MRVTLPLLALAGVLAGCATTSNRRVDDLQQQLLERDAEIARLRQQLAGGARQSSTPAEAEQSPRERPAVAVAPTGLPDRPDEADPDTRALEQALVQRGTQLLQPGVLQIEPEWSYFYSEVQGSRRDTFRSALTARIGLPWAAQAEVRVPIVLRDHLQGGGSSSGLGDVVLGLSKEVLTESDYVPTLVLSGRWWTNTGRRGRPFATGLGTDAFQVQLTASKRQDPVVLFGSLNYTTFAHAKRIERGDVVGGTLGAFLAATPDISLLLAVDASSSASDRLDGERISRSGRLSGIAEFGIATVLRRGVFLNVLAGAGFTAAAPDFVLVISLPVQF